MNPRLIATAVVSMAVGAAIGYKIAENRLSQEFEERLERETNLVRRMYKPEYNTPEEMVQDLHGVITTEIDEIPKGSEADKALGLYAATKDLPPLTAYHTIRTSGVQVVKDDAQPPIKRKVFEPDDDRGEIYVISADEHQANESGYENVTWSYYAGDGVVTDIHEDRIEDYAKFIGAKFAESFGGSSGDENVVYVRNEIVMIDYEIVRSPGTYRQEVLGEEPPPQRPSQRINGG